MLTCDRERKNLTLLRVDLPSFILAHVACRWIFVNKNDQQVRKEFYCNSVVKQHVKTEGVPKTVASFRAMVSSGTDVNLNSTDGANLLKILKGVTFSKHPQQINIMDKSSGETIVSIAT